MLEWEATDNFGNLMVAKSEAETLDDLKEDLRSLVEEALHRTPSGAAFAVDVAYGEIAAPDGNAVTHILQIPLLAKLKAEGQSAEDLERSLVDQLSQIFAGIAGCDAKAQGPWEF